jgi:hypothetical protein
MNSLLQNQRIEDIKNKFLFKYTENLVDGKFITLIVDSSEVYTSGKSDWLDLKNKKKVLSFLKSNYKFS